MARSLPSYERPPVVEVVLGVQFDALPGFTSGHLGWFWKSKLDNTWGKAADAPRLPDVFEGFSPQKTAWVPRRIRIQIAGESGPDRLQISNTADDRMIQVQDTRFVYNWIKKNGVYPRYPSILAEFDRYYALFLEFSITAGLSEIRPNHWEVTYVNRIPSGDLWNTPSQWHSIVPGLFSPAYQYGGTSFESLNGEWRSVVQNNQARLHVVAHYQDARSSNEDDAGDLVLNLTARGRVTESQTLSDGLNLGHETIVRAFDDMTSEAAHTHWGKL